MKLTRVGVDLAKSVFQVHGVDERGQLVWKRRLKRATWLRVFTETVASIPTSQHILTSKFVVSGRERINE